MQAVQAALLCCCFGIPGFPSAQKSGITFQNKAVDGTPPDCFVFHDENGRITKRISAYDFPDDSRFKNLPLPRDRQSRKLTRYNLRNLSSEQRKRIVQKAGIAEIPEPALLEATAIAHFPNENPRACGHDQYLIAVDKTEVLKDDTNGTHILWQESHLTIYDHTGNVARQMPLNANADPCISDNGRFLLVQVVGVQDGNSGFYRPYLLYDLKKNSLDTIDIAREAGPDINPVPWGLAYVDGAFQLIQEVAVENSTKDLHIIVDPIQRIVYSKFYERLRWKPGYALTPPDFDAEVKIDLSGYSRRGF